MLRFDEAAYHNLFLKFILSEGLSNSLLGLDTLYNLIYRIHKFIYAIYVTIYVLSDFI